MEKQDPPPPPQREGGEKHHHEGPTAPLPLTNEGSGETAPPKGRGQKQHHAQRWRRRKQHHPNGLEQEGKTTSLQGGRERAAPLCVCVVLSPLIFVALGVLSSVAVLVFLFRSPVSWFLGLVLLSRSCSSSLGLPILESQGNEDGGKLHRFQGTSGKRSTSFSHTSLKQKEGSTNPKKEKRQSAPCASIRKPKFNCYLNLGNVSFFKICIVILVVFIVVILVWCVCVSRLCLW